MFSKQRSHVYLLLTSTIAIAYMTLTMVATRNILAANFMTVESIDYIAFLEGAYVAKTFKASQRQKKTVAFLTPQTNSSYISLAGVHVAAAVIAGIVLLAKQIVSFCKFNT